MTDFELTDSGRIRPSRDPAVPTLRDIFRMLDIAGKDGCIACAAMFEEHKPATHTVTFPGSHTALACAEHINPELWAPSPDQRPGRVPQGEVSVGAVLIAPIAPEAGREPPPTMSLMCNEHGGEIVGVRVDGYPYAGARPIMLHIECWREGVDQLKEELPLGWTLEDWADALNRAAAALDTVINEHQAGDRG